MTARNSSGSSRRDNSTDPTRSQYRTVTCRRSPSAVTVLAGSGDVAGPETTAPSARANLLLWQAQSMVSVTAETTQPWCVQTAENALKSPAAGWVTTILASFMITPPPSGTSALATLVPAAAPVDDPVVPLPAPALVFVIVAPSLPQAAVVSAAAPTPPMASARRREDSGAMDVVEVGSGAVMAGLSRVSSRRCGGTVIRIMHCDDGQARREPRDNERDTSPARRVALPQRQVTVRMLRLNAESDGRYAVGTFYRRKHSCPSAL